MGTASIGAVLSTQYSMVTLEGALQFGRLSAARGVYEWTDVDAAIDWAEAHGMAVHGHALVCISLSQAGW